MCVRNYPEWRGVLGTAILIPALGASLLLTPSAHAKAAICRTDPLVHLSNGTVVQIVAEAEADPSSIQSITYTLHVPHGLSITEVEYMGDVSPENEQLLFVDDADDRHYKTETVVEAAGKDVHVTAIVTIGDKTKSAHGHPHSRIKTDLDIH
jgi:hypothetical protein